MAKAMNSRKITKNLFDAAKLLFENGAKGVEVCKYLNIGKDVVCLINHAETYEEYQNAMYKRNRYKVEPKAAEPKEVKQTVTVQANWQIMQEMQKTNELLKQISNKLAFIVEELTGVKSNA